jgi:hypothetical protein
MELIQPINASSFTSLPRLTMIYQGAPLRKKSSKTYIKMQVYVNTFGLS